MWISSVAKKECKQIGSNQFLWYALEIPANLKLRFLSFVKVSLYFWKLRNLDMTSMIIIPVIIEYTTTTIMRFRRLSFFCSLNMASSSSAYKKIRYSILFFKPILYFLHCKIFVLFSNSNLFFECNFCRANPWQLHKCMLQRRRTHQKRWQILMLPFSCCFIEINQK